MQFVAKSKMLAAGLIALAYSSLGYMQELDETWTLSIGAETVQVNADGSFLIPNISAPDEFGPDGPGTRPDFLSDDWVRLTGYSTKDGVTQYCWTEPFRLTQNQRIIIRPEDLTFAFTPPPVPKSILVVAQTKNLTSIGQTSQVTVTAFLADGTDKDATLESDYTTYRTSNINIASISGDGLVTARKEGKVFITAINEGVTAVTQINVTPGADFTQIVGVVSLADGTPIANAEVILAGLDISALTDENGAFTISDVPISDVVSIDAITVQSISENGVFFGSTTAPELLAGQITDAGLIELMDLCEQLGNDLCVDSDGDCIPDSIEIALGLDPNDPDSDDNTIPDGEEDPDLDGLTNCAEIFLGTDPQEADSDNDGLDDGEEVFAFGTNPQNPDTDFDGLNDGIELFPPEGFPDTDPFKADSDLDGVDDGLEIAAGTNPLDAASRPPVRVYSREVDFLNALLANTLDQEPTAKRVSSPIVSFLNATFATGPAGEAATTIVASLVATYKNEVTPPSETEHTHFVSSFVTSYLNGYDETEFESETNPVLVSSDRVSFYNFTNNPQTGEEERSSYISSPVINYFNQP